MIKLDKKENCCGCSACVQICPQKCIKMKTDLEGFEYPYIDQKRCIKCGLCEKTCPIINKNKLEETPLAAKKTETFIGYANYAVREESSSGGVFSLIAENILKNNGIVFGAAYDEKFTVHHIGVSNDDDLALIRGSKYVQSRIENTYIEVEEEIKAGKIVLFSGTMCQIEGLKKYLGQEYDNLFTVDVLCHGVPSPKVWKKYLDEQEKKYASVITGVSCRSKINGWKNYSYRIKFNNGKVYEKPYFKDDFSNLFLGNICLRPSCHQCEFKEIPRKSDITLGDAWGIRKLMPEMDDDRGTSVILCHTKKGKELLQCISKNMVIKNIDTDLILPEATDSRNSVEKNKNREQFFLMLNKGKGMRKLVKLTDVSLLVKVSRKINNKLKKVRV